MNSAKGLKEANLYYPIIAKKHQMYVIQSNAIGYYDHFLSVGGSAAWGKEGALLAQMDNESEGILLVDIGNNDCSIY